MEKGKAWDQPRTLPALRNSHCDFRPYVQVVQLRSDIELVNEDAVFHNLHSFLGKVTVHNVSLPKNGRPVRRAFSEPGMVRVECDAHSWMKAWVYVADSPYYAMTDKTGRFAIRDLIWLTVVAALCVAWWIDRGRLAVPLADYRRLKAAEASQDAYLRSEEGVLLSGARPSRDAASPRQ